MPYISSVERHAMERGLELGIEQGIEQGLRESILDLLEMRFNQLPDDYRAGLGAIKEIETLRLLRKKAYEVENLSLFGDYLRQ